MKKLLHITLATLAFASLSATGGFAQEKSAPEFTIGADLVSKYVWRGVNQCGASLQPYIDLSWKGLSLGAWGSTEIGGGDFKELDAALGYSLGGFSATVTDYFWAGQGVSFYDHYLDSHLIEGTLAYHFGEKYPFSLSWSTFLAGDLDKDEDGDRQYSTYIEIGYDFALAGLDCTASVGVAPWDSHVWLVPAGSRKGFQVSSISLCASKEIEITPEYALPIFVQAVASPATDDAHLVFGMSF